MSKDCSGIVKIAAVVNKDRAGAGWRRGGRCEEGLSLGAEYVNANHDRMSYETRITAFGASRDESQNGVHDATNGSMGKGFSGHAECETSNHDRILYETRRERRLLRRVQRPVGA